MPRNSKGTEDLGVKETSPMARPTVNNRASTLTSNLASPVNSPVQNAKHARAKTHPARKARLEAENAKANPTVKKKNNPQA